jgi:hypothetical protein
MILLRVTSATYTSLFQDELVIGTNRPILIFFIGYKREQLVNH